MARLLAAFAIASLSATGVTAAELVPENGYSIQLGHFDGSVYYTVEPDGYRVVATLASGGEPLPIRFVSTLEPGQSMVISVPRSVGEPPVDFRIVRDGEALVMGDPVPAPVVAEKAALGSIQQ